tara:strand:- start:604 stop:1458 length:855 start_codon:yes stop_codon:yes gene_type:complete
MIKKLFIALAIILVIGVVLTGLFAQTKMGKVIFSTMQIENNLAKSFDNCPDMEFTGDFAKDYARCNFVDPPAGLWHAVYTKDFADAYNLPPENITDNLSNGVAYMEMETLQRTNDSIACVTNMLVERPNDISKWGREHSRLKLLPEDRKLLHFIDIQKNGDDLKPLGSFSSIAHNDDNSLVSGFMGSSDGGYIENAIEGYDFFTIGGSCDATRRLPYYYPDGYTFYIYKASIWGLYKKKYTSPDQRKSPEVQGLIKNSHLIINIPEEIIESIFSGLISKENKDG